MNILKDQKDKSIEEERQSSNKELEDFLEGSYVSMKDGDRRVLEFRTKGTVVEKPGFDGKTVEKVQFVVANPGNLRQKKLELARTHAKGVYSELQKGFSVLELQRTGSASDTRYNVKGIR